MARTARILYDEGIYHILNRGNNKHTLFYDSTDYAVFKKLTKRYLATYKVKIYHYVPMPNHFHFSLRVLKAKDLPKFMKGLCQTYAQYHHRRYGSVGYLFQNRYKSLLIKDEQYLLECARYIERNPLRANLVNNLDDYPYSSYHYYAKGSPNSLVTPNPLYLKMGKTPSERRKAYIEYINAPTLYEQMLDEKLQISR